MYGRGGLEIRRIPTWIIRGTSNIEHRTLNAEVSGRRVVRRSMLNVECSMFSTSCHWLIRRRSYRRNVVSDGGNCFRSLSQRRLRTLWRIQPMFEQRGHVALDGFELVQPQVRIGNREHVAGPRLFVNEYAFAVADDLFLHLQHTLAFEHDGEDVTGGRVTRVVLLNQFPQQRFGGVLVNRIGGGGGG